MVETKKTTAVKPVTKKNVKTATEVKSIDSLRQDLVDKQRSLMDSRRAHLNGELVNPRILSTIRKEIARLYTAIRAAELAAKESK